VCVNVCAHVCVLAKQVMAEHFAAEQGLVTEAEELAEARSRQARLGGQARCGGREVEKTGGSRGMALLNLSLCRL
jgi:hypothetical protein